MPADSRRASALWKIPTGAAALVAASMGATWLRIVRAGRERPVPVGDVLIVFGARAAPTGPSPELAARLDYARRLFEAGHATRIVCSGGVLPTHSEAGVMAEALIAGGVPADAVLVDTAGGSTKETIANLARFGPEQRLLAVSSAYHVHRIAREARRQGIAVSCCPVRDTPIMRSPRARRRQMVYEVATAWWYARPAS